MSPVYKDIEMKNDFFYEHYKEAFPSQPSESIASMSHSVVHDSIAEDGNNNGAADLGGVLQSQQEAAMAEAE